MTFDDLLAISQALDEYRSLLGFVSASTGLLTVSMVARLRRRIQGVAASVGDLANRVQAELLRIESGDSK